MLYRGASFEPIRRRTRCSQCRAHVGSNGDWFCYFIPFKVLISELNMSGEVLCVRFSKLSDGTVKK